MQNILKKLRKKNTIKFPEWRLQEIVSSVLLHLMEEEFYKKDFDVIRMIEKKGIILKPFSHFEAVKEKKIRKLIKKGMFFSNSDSIKIICYNDNLDFFSQIKTILHEYAHYYLGHTEHCIHGEIEATYFANVMHNIILLENQYCISEKILKGELRVRLYRNIHFCKQEVNKKIL